MPDIAQTTSHQPPDWAPTRQQIDRIKLAMLNEAYPPAGRTGIGTVLRRFRTAA